MPPLLSATITLNYIMHSLILILMLHSGHPPHSSLSVCWMVLFLLSARDGGTVSSWHHCGVDQAGLHLHLPMVLCPECWWRDCAQDQGTMLDLQILWGWISGTCEIFGSTVQPRLSGPRLSGTSIIRTRSCPANVHVRMRRGCGRLHLVGVAIAEQSAGHVCGRETARNDKRRRIYESFWRSVWSKNAVSYQDIYWNSREK